MSSSNPRMTVLGVLTLVILVKGTRVEVGEKVDDIEPIGGERGEDEEKGPREGIHTSLILLITAGTADVLASPWNMPPFPPSPTSDMGTKTTLLFALLAMAWRASS